MLKGAGYSAESVDSPGALLDAARTRKFDLILADLNYTRDTTSGAEGLDLLAALDAQGNQIPVIVMTAWGSIELAVEAMQRGACDFIQKPWDNARALETVRKQARTGRRRASELETAAAVQQKLFPASQVPLSTLDYAGRCIPAQDVGGDYFDFLEIGQGRAGFLLGDVCGKGVSAALLMANLQACFHSYRPADLSKPAQLLTSINRHFYSATDSDRFATLFYGVYDDASRTLRYVNCGHCPPILVRASGEVLLLEPTATVIGAFAEWDCAEAEVTIGDGDRLLLYSDGVIDTVDRGGNALDAPRLCGLIAQQASAAELVNDVVTEVAKLGGAQPVDDVTVVALRGR